MLTSNFSAEDQKGPILITSVTKAGGSQYHGQGFFTARNHVLNANDWLNNNSNVKQPANIYYYPGGDIGGPVYIPKLGFNKNRDKLFFFTGFEYFYQKLDTGLLRSTMPTPGELGGNFSPEEVAKEGAILGSTGKAPGQLTSAAITKFGGTQVSPCSGPANGTCIDPNMLALAKLYPAPNADPNATQGYNYTSRKSLIKTTGSGLSAVITTSAKRPKYLFATTISAKYNSSRSASGGGRPTRCLTRPRWRVRTNRTRTRDPLPTFLIRR